MKVKSFIEDFYYGEIDPQKKTDQSDVTKKHMEILKMNEDSLTKMLTGKSLELFLEYVNAWSVICGEEAIRNYKTGFRHGAAFTYDTFFASDTSCKKDGNVEK